MSLLEKSIAEARETLKGHHEYLAGNETATRMLVVDVIMAALGWNVRDPLQVRLEHWAGKNNRVDYVLMSSSGGVLAVVEAKPAGAGPRETDRRQASGYATEIGARYAVLTNGARWEAWEMVPLIPRKNNIIVEVHLTTGELAEIASTLERLSRESLEPENLSSERK